tara:strand:- start:578 stop:940 length:363 start_codon:yes stop_codon:yes gene_type:complete
MTIRFSIIVAFFGAALTLPSFGATQSVPMIMSVGCVAQEGDQWWVVEATEPLEITEEVPVEPEVDTPLGDRRLRLIGTLEEFGVENHASHKVRVKGLLIESSTETRLNLTSLRHMSPNCE